MTEIVLHVTGYPAPQGSKKAWVNKTTGRAQMVEQSGDKIQLWRQDVKAAALDWLGTDPWAADWEGPLPGALDVAVTFRYPRPKSHYRTGRYSHLLRDNAPWFPITRAAGDADKCARSTLDALVLAGMFADDAQVAHLDVWQVYTNNPHQVPPGATITIRTLDAVAGHRVDALMPPEEEALL